MISGLYMGELVRLLLEDLARERLLFDGAYEAISRRNCFKTNFIFEIEKFV
jgi:hexokinase